MVRWFEDISDDEYEQWFNNVRKIQSKVAARSRKPADWIARQRDSDGKWVGFGFVVGGKGLFLHDQDVMHDPDDTVFIDGLTSEVLGYPPDSIQDIKAQIAEWDAARARLYEAINKLEVQCVNAWKKRQELSRQLAEIESTDVTERDTNHLTDQQGCL